VDLTGVTGIAGYNSTLRIRLGDLNFRMFRVLEADDLWHFDLRSVSPGNGIYSAYVTAYNFRFEEPEPSGENLFGYARPSMGLVRQADTSRIAFLSGHGFETSRKFGLAVRVPYQVLSPRQIEVEVPAVIFRPCQWTWPERPCSGRVSHPS
jgi:hypothetical protein